MQLYSENNFYKLYEGNMLDMEEVIEPNSIDSIVTDPPYELNFMNKSWDNSGIAFQKETWKKCFKVLKPGGYLLAFGGSRTFHRIACAIEDAGFEIRDTIMYLYGSGFPKSMNIGLAVDKKNGVESKVIGTKEHCKKDFKEDNLYAQDVANRNNTKCFGYDTEIIKEAQNEWKGWGSQLKPAFEPVIVARKPLDGSLTNNVMTWGVGGINIDECRVTLEDVDSKDLRTIHRSGKLEEGVFNSTNCGLTTEADVSVLKSNGRFPANVILTYDETDFDEVCGGFPNSGSGNNSTPYNYEGREYNNKETSMFNGDKPKAPSNYNDNGSASRYFYCSKASKRDRNDGVDGKNNHPTVKPTDLMSYLIRLVTPNGGTILDPFNGSGSTGKGVMYENVDHNKNYKYIGIELTPEYLPIAKQRIEFAISDTSKLLNKQIKPKVYNNDNEHKENRKKLF